jgi:hypothetical protein
LILFFIRHQRGSAPLLLPEFKKGPIGGFHPILSAASLVPSNQAATAVRNVAA